MPASSSPDVGSFDRKELLELSDADKFHILTRHWKPTKDYQFPTKILHSKTRKFQSAWLESYPWLVYSPSLDGCLCKHCLFFAKAESPVGKFVTTPETNWTKALTEIKEHATKDYHRNASVKAENFVCNMTKPNTSIRGKVDADLQQNINDNRKVLGSVVKTVMLCGRQGLALRGHRDDGVLNPDNTSNFNALIEFRIESGDEILRKHLQSCSPTATYISKTTQNNLIQIIADQIRAKLVDKIKSAVHFSLLADEATDSSNWEQLCIVLRYIDSQTFVIREDFLGFVQCEDTTGQTLADKLTTSLQSWGLDLANIRGQGYDGAGNMAGKYKGVQARILQNNPKALYFHCAAHCLNLAIVKSCNLQAIKNMMCVMRDLAFFFNASPKRQRKLETVVSDAFPGTKKAKMVSLCKTRWVERHAAFETFHELYKPVHDCLGQMTQEQGWDGDSATRAAGFLHAIQAGVFLVAFTVVRCCLQYLKPITVKLQESAKDVVNAYKEVGNVTRCIQGLRDSASTTFASWLREANEMSRFMTGHEIERPRTAQRQTLRDNHPAESPEEYFKVSVTIPFLDHLSTELTDRFKQSELAADGLSLVPDVLVQSERGFADPPPGLLGLATLWDSDLPDPTSLTTGTFITVT